MIRIFPVAFLLAGACFTSSAAVDSGLLALAPSHSQTVAAVSVEGSRSSAFGQFLLRQLSVGDDHFQQMIDETGFDPRRDLQAVLIATAPPEAPKAQGRFAVIARGNFDANRIKAAAQKKGFVVQHFSGVDLLIGTDSHQQAAFAFPDVDLAVMGDMVSVKQVIGNWANPASLDPALQEQIAGVENNDAWFASIAPPKSGLLPLDADGQDAAGQSRALQSVIRSSGGISFGPSANIAFHAVTRSAQDATALADVLRFLASMAQMQGGKDPRAASLVPALDSMKLDVAGSAVHVSLQVPEPVLEQIAHPGGKLAARSAR